MSLWYPCVYCTEDLKCTKYSDDEVTSYCLLGTCHDETKSNADRVRKMSDEELADYHTKMCGCPPGHDPTIFCGMATIGCKGCWLSWLKAPVEVDNG